MKKMSRLLLLTSLMTATLDFAQSTTGIIPYSSYASHQYDTINLSNTNVMITAPVRSKSGSIPFQARVVMNIPPVAGAPVAWYIPAAALSLQVAGTGTSSYLTTNQQCPYPDNRTTTWYHAFKFTDSTGAAHNFPNIDFDSLDCGIGSGNGGDWATDGSGLAATYTQNPDGTIKSFDITDVNGNKLDDGTLITDVNGNSLTFNSGTNQYTDSMGMVVLTRHLGDLPPVSVHGIIRQLG